MSKFKFDHAEATTMCRLLIADICAHGNHGKFIASAFATHMLGAARHSRQNEVGSLLNAGTFCAPKVKTRLDFKLIVASELIILAIMYDDLTSTVDCAALGADGLLSITGDLEVVTAKFNGVEHSVPRNKMKRLSDAIKLVGDSTDGYGELK